MRRNDEIRYYEIENRPKQLIAKRDVLTIMQNSTAFGKINFIEGCGADIIGSCLPLLAIMLLL